MTTTTYQVEGMTCDHCVRAVTTELIMLDGVRSVDVNLPEGAVTVVSEAPIDLEDVREAIDEAGYLLVGS
jgi:copper chaperone